MNYLQIANSPAVWICVVPAVVLVLIQAGMFAKKAYSAGLEIGLTKEQLKTVIRASTFSSFGPSLAILSGLLALLPMIGGPIAWMRLSYIGNVVFETMAFNFGVSGAGATTDAMTEQAFITGVWTMIIGSLGWIICSILFTDKMELLEKKLSGGDPAKLGFITGGAMVGGLCSMSVEQLFKKDLNSVANIAGIATMVIIQVILSKGNKKFKWLGEWSLMIALVVAMVVASLFK